MALYASDPLPPGRDFVASPLNVYVGRRSCMSAGFVRVDGVFFSMIECGSFSLVLSASDPLMFEDLSCKRMKLPCLCGKHGRTNSFRTVAAKLSVVYEL